MQLCSTAFTVCCQHSTDTTSQEGSFMLPLPALSSLCADSIQQRLTYYRNQEIFPALFLLCAVRIDTTGARKDCRHCFYCVLLGQTQQEPGKIACIVFIVCCQYRYNRSQERLPALSSLCAVSIDRAGAKKDYRYCLHCVLLNKNQEGSASVDDVT